MSKKITCLISSRHLFISPFYIHFFLLSHQGKQVIIQSIPISQPGAGNYKGCLPQVQNLSVLSHSCGVGTFGLYRLIPVLYRWIYVSKRYTCSRHVNPAGFITDVRKKPRANCPKRRSIIFLSFLPPANVQT